MKFRPIHLIALVFDLKGTDDNPSFSKIGWWAVFIACLMNHQFSIFWGLLFGAWAFGRSAFMSYIASKPAVLDTKLAGSLKDITGG